ncbi:hypothetical protein C8R48DRAFT_675068 [Suillus tomentosus]|nr:hypothetical protein C8R48DRAFT_680271 [Suillus tomentosus]KAG1856267.1 hypothetical protein C8R48DRAFT_675068 [Suillus tomentosus]
MPSRIFLCKCTRCCEVGDDGVPSNPGGKELPVAMKHVHLLQAANIASSSREASSSQHLAHPAHLRTTSTPVDDLAAELFAITLSDNEADPDSHSKLWVSRSEVQRAKGKGYSLDATTNLEPGLTLQDTQLLKCGASRGLK